MLIDTEALIWYSRGDARLSKRARMALYKPGHFLSVASVWESAIKSGLKKLELRLEGRAAATLEFFKSAIEKQQLKLMPITIEDAARVESLPAHHKDPFDRLIAAQALERDFAIISADQIFDAYGVRRVW